MKKLIAALAVAVSSSGWALAADMPLKAPPPPASVYAWTGFYIGANAGYGWNDPSVTYTPNDVNAYLATCGDELGLGGTCVPPANFNIAGAVAGGQVGYNWQINTNWLVGLETDLDWSGIRGQSGPSNFFLTFYGPGAFSANEKIDWFGTLRGRVGILPINPLLMYATGGLAYGGVKQTAFMPGPAAGLGSGNNGGFSYSCGTVSGQANCFAGSASQTLIGWTLGAGGEYMITNNITVRAEYLYVALGRTNGVDSVATSTQANPGTAPSSFTANFSSVSFNVVRGGVNWKF